MRAALLALAACGSPGLAPPVANSAPPRATGMSACPTMVFDIAVRRGLGLTRAFPQCPPEPFEYAYWVCGASCPKPCRVRRTDSALLDNPATFDSTSEHVDATYEGGRVVRLDFRERGAASAFEHVALTYDAGGRLVGESRVSGHDRPTTTVYAYDDDGRVISIANSDEDTHLAYARDRLVRVDTLLFNAHGTDRQQTTRTLAFSYDAAGRLATETTSWTHDFSDTTTTHYDYDCRE